MPPLEQVFDKGTEKKIAGLPWSSCSLYSSNKQFILAAIAFIS